MKISIREALFGGEEVDDWTPTASWEQYFTMLPAGAGNIGPDGWTQEQVDMLYERFGKDKFRASEHLLMDSNGKWLSIELYNNAIKMENMSNSARFGVSQSGFPYAMSNNHLALIKNVNVPLDKFENFLDMNGEELDAALSSSDNLITLYQSRKKWNI